MPSFGELLRQRRLAAGLTQEALAERVGVSAKAISDPERDPGRTPRLDTVGLLAEESLVVARRYDDQWSSAMSLTLLGHLRPAEGDPERARAELAEAAALFAATGNLVYLPWCLEALAAVAVAGSELTRAAELTGARDALRAQTGALVPPVHRAAYEQMLDVARSGLGEAGFAAHGKLAHLAPPDIIEAIMEGEDRHE
jgi:transcriptional regulator with XRE-family HTH domain